MADLTNLTEDPVARPSRRKVLVGTAWAVPVVMGVGATPAMAASKIVSATARMAAKYFTFTVNTSGAGDSSVTITSVVGSPELNWTGQGSPLKTVQIVNHTATITGTTSTNPNSPPVTYTVNYTVTGVSGSHQTTFRY